MQVAFKNVFNLNRKTITKSSPTYISIQTTSFSGATLLAILLMAHPQIATIAEMDGPFKDADPEKYSCSCGQKMKACEFWRSVQIEMYQRGVEFDLVNFDTRFELAGPPIIQYLRKGSTRVKILDKIRDEVFYAWPKEKHQLQTLVARNDALIESVLNVTDRDVFVDTSKGRLKLRAMRKFSKCDVRVIHLIRDVRGVITSKLRRNTPTSLNILARKWLKSHQSHQRALASLPKEAYITVRYEDLCRDVSGTLERLYNFCGVDPKAQVADIFTKPHHIIGNKMRLRSQSEIELDERWKSELTKEQLQEIDRVAGNLNRQYGYC